MHEKAAQTIESMEISRLNARESLEMAQAIPVPASRRRGKENRRNIANCLVAVGEDTMSVAGYYTLSATSVIFDGLPDAIKKKLPRQDGPAALVGRPAADLHRSRPHTAVNPGF